MPNYDELAVAQRALIERRDQVIDTFAVDPGKLNRRNALVLLSLTTAVFLFSLLSLGSHTPLWGNLIGAFIGAILVILLTRSGSSLRQFGSKAAPLVLTERALIGPDGQRLEVSKIKSVKLKNSLLYIKATAPLQDLTVFGLADPEKAANAIETARVV